MHVAFFVKSGRPGLLSCLKVASCLLLAVSRDEIRGMDGCEGGNQTRERRRANGACMPLSVASMSTLMFSCSCNEDVT